MTPLTPAGQAPDIRHVKMWRDLWDAPGMALRSWDGRAITIDWGEPDAEGWWEPTFHVASETEADRTRQAADRALAELRREVEAMFYTDDEAYSNALAEEIETRVLALIDKASKPEEGA